MQLWSYSVIRRFSLSSGYFRGGRIAGLLTARPARHRRLQGSRSARPQEAERRGGPSRDSLDAASPALRKGGARNGCYNAQTREQGSKLASERRLRFDVRWSGGVNGEKDRWLDAGDI
jgi:hypothetical protein